MLQFEELLALVRVRTRESGDDLTGFILKRVLVSLRAVVEVEVSEKILVKGLRLSLDVGGDCDIIVRGCYGTLPAASCRGYPSALQRLVKLECKRLTEHGAWHRELHYARALILGRRLIFAEPFADARVLEVSLLPL